MIELRHVTKRFADVVALDDVSLTIRAGEFFTLLGPSGCGKTTLLRLIGGFETPDSGEVLLDGADVSALPPYRRPVNQVFQNYALFPHLTVEQNVAFGLKMAGVPRVETRRRVAEAIALVSLKSLERRKPAQLSGGQKQRVALARALVNRPKTLLLDEPLAALDAQLRQSMQLELKQLQQIMGITFVFVTHDQDEAMVLSDRIAMMSGGAIVQIGSPRQLYDRPATLEAARFIGQANILSATIESSTACTASGLRLRILNAADLPPAAQLVIRPEGIARCDSADADFSAIVSDVLFRGEVIQFRLTTTGGEWLLASGWDRRELPLVGQTVHCRVDPASIRCLADDAPSKR